MKIKSKIVVTLAIFLCFFFGLSMTPAALASDPGYPENYYGTIPHNLDPDMAWFIWIPIDFVAGKQVHMKLTLIDPPDYTDPDIYVTAPGVDGDVWVGGMGWTGTPVAEDGYFYTPVTATYQIGILNYFIPDPDGTDYDLFIDVGDDFITYAPLESNGLTLGELTSYAGNSENAKERASDNAGFSKVSYVHDAAFINFVTLPPTEYTLPLARFCASDPLAVGGFVWFMPAFYFKNMKEAKDYMSPAHYDWYIDGEPLSDLTSVSAEVIEPYFHAGEKIGYLLYSPTGIFKAGELAELIETGKHTLRSELSYYGFVFLTFNQDFWLLPEGSTGP